MTGGLRGRLRAIVYAPFPGRYAGGILTIINILGLSFSRGVCYN